MKKLLGIVVLALGLTGIFAASAPSANAALACVKVNVRIGDTRLISMVDPVCI